MNFLRFYLYTIILHLTLTGSSFVQIGDAVSVKLDSSVAYTNTDNLFRDDSNKESDGYFTITPGVEVSFGQNQAGLDLKLGLAYDLTRYSDFDQFDSDLLKFNIGGSTDQRSNFDTKFSYSQVESQSPRSSFDVAGDPDLIEATQTRFSVSTEFSYSPKLSIGLGIKGNDLEFDTFANQLAGKESYTIPFDLIFSHSEKLDVVYGITYTNRDVNAITATNRDAYETDSYYYNVGLRGDLLPKLSGQFSVGYRTLEYSNDISDLNTLGIKSSLNWKLTPKFQSLISINRGFDSAGSGETYELTTVRIANSYTINSEYAAGLNFGFSEKDYRSRTDNMNDFSLTLTYIPNYNNQFTIGFFMVDSDYLIDYEVEELRFSADFKY